MDDRRLLGFGITGFRSLGGGEPQYVGPLAKVHLLAGPNNAGKSNILAVAQRLLPTLAETTDLKLEAVDRPAGHGGSPGRVRLSIARKLTTKDLDQALTGKGLPADAVERILKGATFERGSSGLTWFEFQPELDNPGQATNWRTSDEQVRDADASDKRTRPVSYGLQDLSMQLTGSSGGDRLGDARRVMERLVDLLQVRQSLPPVVTVGAFRQITSGVETPGSRTLNGSGLIERLARLERPSYSNLEDRERFARITLFVRTLLDDRNAAISIPQDVNDVLITHGGQTLPLANYGTGVQQIVIMAAAATALEGHLVCLEEPEIHLHPTMQRTLLRYLADETSNQYLIATHSAHLLDAGRASISAVRMTSTGTTVAPAVAPREIADISAELGFRASDIVQSNAVVWVEGPSDRTYLKHWLTLADPDLVEGVHYSLMFYGGGLLRHLSPDDPGVDEFVALPRINRNFAVVIDSDKTGPRKVVNATKRRIKEAIEDADQRTTVWTTKGYTIENYVPHETLRAAVEAAHPGTTCNWTGEQYENPFGEARISGSRKTVDKPAVARRVIDRWPTDRWPLDLRARIGEIAQMIRSAN